jgi:hypothetical protein
MTSPFEYIERAPVSRFLKANVMPPHVLLDSNLE